MDEPAPPVTVLPVGQRVPGTDIIVTSLELWPDHFVVGYGVLGIDPRTDTFVAGDEGTTWHRAAVIWEASDDADTRYESLGGMSGSGPGGTQVTRGDQWFRPPPPAGANVLRLIVRDGRGDEAGRIEIPLGWAESLPDLSL